MNPKPVIFLSAVSRELRTARQLVANTLTFLGYEPDWQDIFGAEHGDVRAMLRRRIDASAGVVQLVGHCYGAEPPMPDDKFGRVSYTQYEALYAKQCGKPLWLLFIDEDFSGDPHEVEADELCKLQMAYREKIRGDEHLYHPLKSNEAIEASVLKLRNELGGLRRRTKQFALLVLGLLALGIVAVFAVMHGQWSQSAVLVKQSDQIDSVLSHQQKLEQIGGENPETLRSVKNHGVLLFEKDDYEGAEPLFHRALEGSEKALGPEHPETLDSALNLGNVLSLKSDYDRAEALYRRALAGYEKALGAQHPDTLRSVNNLGVLLSNKGDFEGAEALYRRALEDCEKALGYKDPLTLGILANLGNVLNEKADYEGAEPLIHRALEGYQRTLGAEHSGTLKTMNTLGRLLFNKRDYAEAEVVFRRALSGREKVLGLEHPATLATLGELGMTLKRNQRPRDAADLLRRFYGLSESCADALRYNLACYECISGNTEKAKRLIAEHLKLHPERKKEALVDEDFAAIKSFISTL